MGRANGVRCCCATTAVVLFCFLESSEAFSFSKTKQVGLPRMNSSLTRLRKSSVLETLSMDWKSFVEPASLASWTSVLKATGNKEEDFPPSRDDDYAGNVDWDEEWKKVVRGEGQPIDRPSGDPKSEMELAAMKAQRQAEEKLFQVKSSVRRNINFKTLSSDWKFWIGILAVLSIATSLISAAGVNDSYSTKDTFYI